MTDIREQIRKKDLFGHPIMLQYNRRGSAHQTACGGIFSMVVRLIIVVYTITLLKKLTGFEDDKNSSIESLIKDKSMITNVSMGDTGVSFSLVLMNSDTDMPIPFDHKHMFKYIRVRALTLTKD